ncbi:endonuclease domain-containing protein [Mesorhizobium sp. LHD-90]|uniref:endonuclease domain-containing protein n=1 Tax=Mesorhizobium sp. LHD-90 TaxID=3071414 RepID=UPI0027DEB5CF|nr:endonuclease domain-containing protein [Mesorhizobium sp. LHD-90]MDQ6436021.1 endonuclease domain-containing protein [Mesorhizobium sp. LHD-90]
MSKLDRFKRQAARGKRAETDAEQALWNNLYRIPLEGTHFRRQVAIGPYRADFGSLRLKLLIEVDGLIHDKPARTERDLRRSDWLENEGYRVIRFSNHDVMTDMNSVLRAIDLAIESQKRALGAETMRHPTPALTRRPSPSRGG